MASSKSNSNQKTRTRSASSASSSYRSAKKKNTAGTGQIEIILLILFLACLVMFGSVIGFGGIVGDAVGGILFGAAGRTAYAVPFVIFISITIMLAGHGSVKAVKKAAALIVFLLLTAGFVQLVTDGCPPGLTLHDYFQTGSDYHTGGGYLGGAAAVSFSRAFGVVGAEILLVFLMLSCLIVITQESYLNFVSGLVAGIISLFQGARTRYDEGQPERKLRREVRQREREQLRQERKSERLRRLEESLNEEDMSVSDEEADEILYGKTNRKKRRFLEGTELKKTEEDMPETLDTDTGADDDFIIPEEKKTVSRKTSASKKKPASRKKSPVIQDITEEITGLFLHEDAEDDADEPLSDPDEAVSDFTVETPAVQEEEVRAPQPAPSRPRKKKADKAVVEEEVRSVEEEIQRQDEKPAAPAYQFPPIYLLEKGNGAAKGESEQSVRKTAQKLQDTLYNFGVNAKVVDVSVGPKVTRYELQPEMGVKVASIVRLADDIKLNLAAADIRIEAPIPGKSAVGIEVPNKNAATVNFRDLIESPGFAGAKSKLAFAVGMDIEGKPVITDIAKMPHLLIAGATGSGKSVCVNTLIMSILFKATPDEVKLIMIDPKVVELSVYNGIPHLLIPVVTDPKKAAGALNWAVAEMTRRYDHFAEQNVRNLKEYNAKIKKQKPEEGKEPLKPLPQIVVIVDELADLMMVAKKDVEDAVCRLAQLARAAGIHLVIATQRPSVDVITGLIKANMPSRIAFAVSSGVDSRTILDMNGAEKLLGKGDMLFYPQGYPKPARLQGALISDEEVTEIVEFLTAQNPKAEYSAEIEQSMSTSVQVQMTPNDSDDRDVYFEEAGRFIIEKQKSSIGMLQRMYKIGFNRAARIMDQLADAGVVGPEEGTKPRKILMTMEEFQNYLDENG